MTEQLRLNQLWIEGMMGNIAANLATRTRHIPDSTAKLIAQILLDLQDGELTALQADILRSFGVDMASLTEATWDQ